MATVIGKVTKANEIGVFGESQQFEGVRGLSHAGNDAGVTGVNDKTGPGVFGQSKTNAGVFGVSDGFEGVHGESHSGNTAAVAGTNHTAPGSIGVWGQSDPGRGVVGVSKTNAGVFGVSDGFEGVHGESHSGNTAAVAGTNHTAPGSIGVWGQSDPGRGVVGVSKTNAGVFGVSDAFDGVHGESHSTTAAGVAGINDSTGIGVFGKGGRLAGLFVGDVEVTGDVRLTNADCAEDFDISGAEKIESGTVMVIDQEGTLKQSQHAYDKRVAGVLSGAGGYRPGIILDKQESQNNRMPIALLGKVYCKVDAQYSPVEAGDLLTTSPTSGYAMKATDPLKAFGAVIGKALHELKDGQGLIPILITLQ